MQLLITPLAAFDLEEIGDYIAQENPIRAGTFVAELRVRKILSQPCGLSVLWRLSRTDAFLSGPLLPFLSIEIADRALGEDGTNDRHRTWLWP